MMPLRELVRGLEGVQLSDPSSVGIAGLCLDSRRTKPNDLFAALDGAQVDGHRFIDDALARGAKAILSHRARPSSLDSNTAWLVATQPRRTLAHLSRRLHGNPDERLDLVGITGTNGKTSTAEMLRAALSGCDRPTATVGTLGMKYDGLSIDTQLTTPESPDLWAFLERIEKAGARGAAIEVSSAALIADRTDGMRFAAAILTSLGRDHLDLHGDLESYYAAKRRLFESLDESAVALLPSDEPHARSFADACPARVIWFGTDPSADWQLSNHENTARETTFTIRGPRDQRIAVSWNRPAVWDALNLCASVACADALGSDSARAARASTDAMLIPGRWQQVDAGQDFTAVVDYAHTPDALERALRLARDITRGRVLVVFGCGGDRDRDKRSMMGEISGQLADVVVVTDDNPRSEDPEAIADEILLGARSSTASVRRVANRRHAIDHVVAQAQAGDVVLIAGKGHETYQEVGTTRSEFDDRVQLERSIRSRETSR